MYITNLVIGKRLIKLLFEQGYGKLIIILYRIVLIGLEVMDWKQRVDFILRR